MAQRALTEKLIAYDTSAPEGIRLAAGFVKGWLEARDIEARQIDVRGLPVTIAEVGPADGTTVLLHGHLDVVPGRPGQFEPRVDGERLFGRGAYDMKGALAAMLLALNDMRDTAEVRGSGVAQGAHEDRVLVHGRGRAGEGGDHRRPRQLADLIENCGRVLFRQIANVHIDHASVGHLVERVPTQDASEVDRGAVEQLGALLRKR